MLNSFQIKIITGEKLKGGNFLLFTSREAMSSFKISLWFPQWPRGSMWIYWCLFMDFLGANNFKADEAIKRLDDAAENVT